MFVFMLRFYFLRLINNLLYILLLPIIVRQGKKPIQRALLAMPSISNCSGLYLSRNVIGTPIIPLHFGFDDDSCVCLFAIDCESMSISWVARYVAVESFNAELVGVVFVEECDWHTNKT